MRNLIVILLIFFLFFGCAENKIVNENNSDININNNKSTEVNSNLVDYANDKLGIQFKYPEDWQVVETGSQDSDIYLEKNENIKADIYLRKDVVGNDEKTQDVLKKSYNYGLWPLLEEKYIKINNFESYFAIHQIKKGDKISWGEPVKQTESLIRYSILYKNDLYFFDFSIVGETYQEYLQTFDQIAYSFNVLESSQTQNSEKISYKEPTICFRGDKDYQEKMIDNKTVSEQIINDFFNNENNNELLQKSTYQEICLINDVNSITFAYYGDYENDNNNAIGLYKDRSFYNKLLFNPNSGDIGICSIKGNADNDIFFSCGGGDGPEGFEKVYLFNPDKEDLEIVKDCSYRYDRIDICTVDNIN